MVKQFDRSSEAYVCHAFGSHRDLKIEPWQLRKPTENDVIIKNHAFAVGYPDLLTIRGEYQRKPEHPFVPGSEFCGTVEIVGSAVTNLQPGDRVMGNALLGAFATRVVADAAQCWLLPERFDFKTGAAYLTAYRTAYVGLVERGGLRQDETVLIHGAAGGVGLAAVNLAKHLGAKVIATVSTASKAALVTQYGADHVLTGGGISRESIKDLTAGRGVDVIYDPVGGDTFDLSMRCIAPFGRILVIGFAGGRIADAATNHILIKQISVIGVRAGEFGRLDNEAGERVNRALMSLAQAPDINPHVYKVVVFDALKQAFEDMIERRVTGRIVVAAT